MNIEIKISESEDILLSVLRKAASGETQNLYQLIDQKNTSWMELQLINNSFTIITKVEHITESDEILRIKLDKLVLEVIEAEQSGTDNNETTIIEDVSPYDPEKIKIHSKAFSLRLISDMIDDGGLDLAPDFQRNYVWDSQQKSRLIESVLLRIPLPMFYFAEDENGRITVVDGLQRLTTIKDFIDNKFPLKGLEYLNKTCDGKYYSEVNKDGSSNGKKAIETKYFRWFNQTQFSVNVIDPTSPPKVKYDIFRRINTGGKPLNNQEIRNCLGTPVLRRLLNDMTNHAGFKTATDFSIKPTRMDDQEVALRFILFSNLYKKDHTLNNYSGYMDPSLDDLTENFSRLKHAEADIWVNSFSNAMKNAAYLFGKKYAFRKLTPKEIEPNANKQLINKALFVCWSVLLAQYDHEVIKLRNSAGCLTSPLAEQILRNTILFAYLSYGTNGKANLQYAFGEAEKLIKEYLKF